MFLGEIRFGRGPMDRRHEDRLASLMSARVRRPTVQRSAHGVLVGGDQGGPGGPAFASLSRLDNRPELAASLGLPSSASESECIQASFERHGDAGVAALLGSFVFAHWDEQTLTLTLARDCAGAAFSLFYHYGDGFAAFATHLSDLLAMPDVPRQLDERMMANFLALNHREVEPTPYRDILRVPSRGIVRITPKGKVFGRYWSANLRASPPYKRTEDYVERARELFDRAVARSVRDTPRMAIRLSGGLDSSAIAATIMRQGGVDLSGFTGVPAPDLVRSSRPGWYIDETDKLRALSAMYPQLKTNLVTPRGAHANQSDPARSFLDLPLPVRNIDNLGWFAQIDEAIQAQGHHAILRGARGNMTMSWGGPFSLAELLGSGRLFELVRQAAAVTRATGQTLPRVLVLQAVLPLLPRETQRTVVRLFGKRRPDIGKFSLINPAIIEDLDLRSQWRADGFEPSYRIQGSSAGMRAHMIFDQLQLSRDIGAMTQATMGVTYRDPYDDRELIEFCLSVPDTLYRRDGVARWFARKVFADRLPPEILNETRRGEQSPNWFESLNERRPRILEDLAGIEASSLANRLLDIPRMKRLLEDWPKDAAEADLRADDLRLGLNRAVHTGQFIRWVEGGNA